MTVTLPGRVFNQDDVWARENGPGLHPRTALCNRAQCAQPIAAYRSRVKRTDRTDETERRGRIDQLIEESRAAKRRRLLSRVRKLWRSAEVLQQLAALEAPPERVH